MYLELVHHDNVVVLIKYNGEHQYYVSDKELWILDLKKLEEAFEIIGYDINPLEDERIRFDILAKRQYSVYKDKITKYKVSYEELSDYYQLFQLTKKPEEDIREILPAFYIDFDKKIFYSFHPELSSYEEYIPEGWQEFLIDDSEKVIPSNMAYWKK